MDEATQNSFRADLEYLKAFEESQENYIRVFVQIAQDPIFINGSNIVDIFTASSSIIYKTAKQILNGFGSINFSNRNLSIQVSTLNQSTGTFKANFTANLEKKDLFSICYNLTFIRTIVETINEIVDSNFSNFIILICALILY
jgi:hypothetical protein